MVGPEEVEGNSVKGSQIDQREQKGVLGDSLQDVASDCTLHEHFLLDELQDKAGLFGGC